jgi:hypothetical protein
MIARFARRISLKIVLANLAGAFALGFLFAAAAPLHATEWDLTSANSFAFDGVVKFQQMNAQSTGTGLIDSFVQIGQRGGNKTIVDAYNTTVNNTLFNGQSDQFNHALALSSVPIKSIGGIDYREFNLDINQTGASPKITLDDVQVYLTNANNSNQGTTDLSQLGTLIYRMDGLTGNDSNTILLDFSLNNGSGSGDMTMLVPDSLFVGGGNSVVLYSHFGADTFGGTNYGNNDGFEEWFVCKDKKTKAPLACTTTGQTSATFGQTPEPASMILFGMGLILGAGRLSKRGKRKD